MKYKILITLILLMMFTIVSQRVDATWCYQESANVSNQTGIDGNCGLSYSGSVVLQGTWISTPANLIDGNWTTSAHGEYINISSNITQVYKKPTGSNYSSVWMIGTGASLSKLNLSINSSCWNNGVSNITLKTSSTDHGVFNYTNDYLCLNSTGGEVNMYSVTFKNYTLVVIEDAMWWSIMQDSVNVSVFDAAVGGLLSDYVLTVSNSSLGVYDTYVVNSSSFVFNWSDGVGLRLNFSKVGYLFVNVSVVPDVGLFNVSLYSLRVPFVNLSIRDVVGGGLIVQNVSVTVTGTSVNNYTTDTGRLFLSNLSLGDNEVKVGNAYYQEARFVIPVTSLTMYALDAYLMNSSVTSNVSFTFYDENGVRQEGVLVTQSVLVGGGYVQMMSYLTDITGVVYFFYNPSYYYLYNYSKSGFESDSFVLNPPRVANYDITMLFAGGGVVYRGVNVSGSASFNNVSNILSFSYVSGNSSIGSYSYGVAHNVNSVPTSVCGESSSVYPSHVFTGCNLSGLSGTLYVSGFADGSQFYGNFLTIPESSLGDVVGVKNGALMTGLILLVITFAGAALGVVSLAVFSVVGILAIFWLGLFSAVTMTLIVVDVVVTFIIILGFRRHD